RFSAIQSTVVFIVDWAETGVTIAHTEKARMMSEATMNTRQLTRGPRLSDSSSGPRRSSVLSIGARLSGSVSRLTRVAGSLPPKHSRSTTGRFNLASFGSCTHDLREAKNGLGPKRGPDHSIEAGVAREQHPPLSSAGLSFGRRGCSEPGAGATSETRPSADRV